MSKKDDGGAAFPMENVLWDGMSLRDWFAGQALAGLNTRGFDKQTRARLCYEQADAMIRERGTQE